MCNSLVSIILTLLLSLHSVHTPCPHSLGSFLNQRQQEGQDSQLLKE